ncbi:hypothetical protein GDO86_012145 [Hymenochirus boettgeri]|uniref:TILa domain-containing protein n=1 Tax=Hymenochirus boettgeri TaxID=247094 RepID=A0A8T2IRK4_9PIPI|nr:hypothetical protein GDO86_012145 [Hymenochirus boettgeri]
MEGCECDEGFYREGDSCLPIEECGCSMNGSYYPQGAEVVEEGCQWKCSCLHHQQWSCEPYSCSSDRFCEMVLGVWDCYPEEYLVDNLACLYSRNIPAVCTKYRTCRLFGRRYFPLGESQDF